MRPPSPRPCAEPHLSSTAAPGDGPTAIHHLFEARAAERPDAPAVAFHGATTSYGELNARANRIARRLRGLGVGPDVAVGVHLRRTPELIATLLGVLKAGGAYVPLDPAYPPERVAFMVDDTRIPVLVTASGLAGRLPAHGAATLVLDDESASVDALDGSDLEVAVERENLAYVIYTSGSTGRPKGVQIEHRGTLALLDWLREAWSDEERDGVLASTSIAFDVSIAELFGTLCWGGRVVLVENALSLAAVTAGVRTACMVPSAAAELLRIGGIPACVRTLALGGEPLRNDLAQRLFALGHVDRVLNLYGPTEDTTYSTCKEVERGRSREMTLGRAVAGTEAHVLDASGGAVERGAEGEIWMAGRGLARGYAGQPALTAERFVPDPRSDLPGARMYRTGDLGRWLPDGDLECLGRVDHQVKVRGYRVEPGEIEIVLARHPGLAEAVVAPWDDRGMRRLAAYYLPAADGGEPSPAELRDFLGARLPAYMVPEAWVRLDAVPRTPNGKVDRLALPKPVLSRAGSAEYVAPSTDDERALAAIWAEVLGVESVGVRDDFFEVGGHSLQVTQVAARVRDAMGVEVPLATLFGVSTIEELAVVVGALRGEGRAATVIPRVPRDGGPLPVTYPQEAIWFFQHLAPDMRSYNFQATLRVRGPLDVAVLERALTEIVRRHEVFRTTFPAVDGSPVQRVHEPWTVSVPVVDLRAVPAAEREDELRRLLREEFYRPFDFARLPLARWTVFTLGEGEHVLVSVEQHLVHDGWSFAVFLRELTTLYSAYSRGEGSPLAEPKVQLGDYAAWHRAWMEAPEAAAQLDFWRRRLAGVPPVLEIPADRPRPAVMSFQGSSHRVRLPAGVFAAADAFAREHGVTLFMTLFAAFQALLHRYTGETDFCVGSGVAGRKTREAEELIGMIVNTVPIRADVSGDPTFAALVERVRGAAVETFAHQDVPFAEIVAAVHPERSRGHLPVFQVAFNFHHAPYPELRLGEATVEIEEGLGNESAKFDLNIIVIPRAHQHTGGDEVVMIWEFARDLFDAETVRRLISHYETLLAGALAAPEAAVSALPLVPPAQGEALLRLSGSETPYPRDATLAELFAQALALAPDAVAVEHDGRKTTYAELDAASSRLAHRLVALGAGQEAPVAVCVDRSAELVVAFVAAVKAGAPYVALDPDHPAARLEFTLRDSRAAVLVVRGEVPSSLAAHPGAVVSLERDRAALEALPADPPRVSLFPESLAYVIYTSGSTGTPKGIGITHRGVARTVRDVDYLQLGPGDVVGQAANVAFDAAAWEIWGTLLNGARLVVLDRDDTLSPPALAARLREAKVNALFLTAALFGQVAAEAPEALAALDHALFGGEAVDPGAVRRVLALGTGARLLNAYGPAECTTYAAWHPVVEVPDDAASIPIGQATANTRVFVVDERLELVPLNVPGELLVGGDGLARGYLGRPGLTAERFVPDALSGRPGERLYRTGDRARRRSDGVLEFLGRADGQVKIRGFRVEPAEVETALRAHPSVADAAVVAREEAGERSLAAYVVASNGAVDPAALREFLASRLPAYMVPAAFVTLPVIPLTPNGKVDRRALPAPEAYGRAPGAGHVEPATETETVIAGIWREVLGVERVGARDNFFDLGGHSLRATRILTRVQAALGVRLPVSALFDHPTVHEMAREIDARRPPADDPEALLRWLDTLSEEEAERILARMQSGGG